MALDKQRILTELGSVVNQLQSADCGCMGKLFSNSGQGSAMGSPCGGCHRGCCHGQRSNYSCNAPFVGEPCSALENHNKMNRACMGNCNPPKLYADTYNYLNKNLMQPVVKEVYHDLKTINPMNTIMNNPLAGQMGLSGNEHGNIKGMNQMPMSGTIRNYKNLGISGGSTNYQSEQQNMGEVSSYKMPTENMNSVGLMNLPMGPTGNMDGMGAQIVSMMMGSNNSKKPVGETPTSADAAPQSLQANNGTKPLNADIYNNNTGINNIICRPDKICPGMQNSNTEFITQANMYNTSNMQDSNRTLTNMSQKNMNPSSQRISPINTITDGQQITGTNDRNYGQHTLGISKFNEMFPGVMQGGDLGFDPMSIALQMNPANHQKVAMDTIQKMINSNNCKGFDGTRNFGIMQCTNAENASMDQTSQQNIIPSSQAVFSAQIPNQLQPTQPITNSNTPNQLLQLQDYTTVSGAPMNHHTPSKQIQQQQQYQSQQQICPNVTTSPNLPSIQNEHMNPNSQVLQQTLPQFQNVAPTGSVPSQQLIEEPIFPVDTLKNCRTQNLNSQDYQYNTLGQPIERTSTKMYHSAVPQPPQTLSPQPVVTRLRHDPMKYSNVKNTISKTSIIDHNPVGRAPSRHQLQNIYNQYKGSQSFTQQNVKGPYGTTYSDGKLNVTPGNGNLPQTRLCHVPVEKIGGDTIANNNAVNDKISNVGQIGDVPTPNEPTGDGVFKSEEPPIKQSKCRNGLQDMVYTSYPTSAAWSFHGNYLRSPISTYRYRVRK